MKFKCESCGNIVSVDGNDIQNHVYELMRIIKDGTNKKVRYIVIISVLDDYVECCDLPNYYEIDE